MVLSLLGLEVTEYISDLPVCNCTLINFVVLKRSELHIPFEILVVLNIVLETLLILLVVSCLLSDFNMWNLDADTAAFALCLLILDHFRL